MPAAWLAWSVASATYFFGRTDGLEVSSSLSGYAQLAVRIVISVVLALGVLCFVLIMNTLRQYGSSMSKQFRTELELIMPAKGWRRPKRRTPRRVPFPVPDDDSDNEKKQTVASASPQSNDKWFQAIKAVSLNKSGSIYEPAPKYLVERGFTQGDWHTFVTEVSQTWARPSSDSLDGNSNPKPHEIIVQLLDKWNRKHFQSYATLAILCQEYFDSAVHSPLFIVYIVDMTPVDNGAPISVQERLGLPSSGQGHHAVIPFEPAAFTEKSPRAGYLTPADRSDLHASTREDKTGTSRTSSIAGHSHSADTISPPASSSQIGKTSSVAAHSRTHSSRSPSRRSRSIQSRNTSSKK
ncbi:hypothetical protein H0H92_003724 [Tricholoma furcatifolium]|nr:hypothetical protein H0H92_003724 [Tricholoma furcatifolium]